MALFGHKIHQRGARIISYLLHKGASTSESLHLAASLGLDTSIIELLIQKGANKKERDERNNAIPLFYARNVQVSRLLISDDNINMKDKYGWTPIMAHASKAYMREMNGNTYNSTYNFLGTPIVRELLRRGASLRCTGSNRDNRVVETQITLLHIISASYLNHPTNGALEEVYKAVCEMHTRGGISRNKRTSLGNTPILYALSKFNSDMYNQYRPNTMRTNKLEHVLRTFIRFGGANISLRNNAGKDAYDIARTLQGIQARELQQMLRPGSQPNTNNTRNTIRNLRIPNNLNFMDPITMNNVSLNNAYILTTDLHRKRNTNTNQNVREVKTVYNKSSLNTWVNTTYGRGGNLVSPITRNPFRTTNIAKLVDVTPRTELNRFKATRNMRN